VGWGVTDHPSIPTKKSKQDAEMYICYQTSQKHFCSCSECSVWIRPVWVLLTWISLWFALRPSRQMPRQCFAIDHNYLHILPGWSLTRPFHSRLPSRRSWKSVVKHNQDVNINSGVVELSEKAPFFQLGNTKHNPWLCWKKTAINCSRQN
jgi:hypothetical protein